MSDAQIHKFSIKRKKIKSESLIPVTASAIDVEEKLMSVTDNVRPTLTMTLKLKQIRASSRLKSPKHVIQHSIGATSYKQETVYTTPLPAVTSVFNNTIILDIASTLKPQKLSDTKEIQAYDDTMEIPEIRQSEVVRWPNLDQHTRFPRNYKTFQIDWQHPELIVLSDDQCFKLMLSSHPNEPTDMVDDSNTVDIQESERSRIYTSDVDRRFCVDMHLLVTALFSTYPELKQLPQRDWTHEEDVVLLKN
jgi:hypothetical protein